VSSGFVSAGLCAYSVIPGLSPSIARVGRIVPSSKRQYCQESGDGKGRRGQT